MTLRCTILLVFFFSFVSASAQKWQWAMATAQDAQYIDLAHNAQGDIITLAKDNQRNFYVNVYGADQSHRHSRELDYNNEYSNKPYAVETDSKGNVYVVSRTSLPEIDPKFTDDVEPLEENSEYYSEFDYIVLEKYSPDLGELLESVRLIKMGGEYAVDVSEMKIDEQDNIWFCGSTTDESYVFMGREIVPGSGGSVFLVHVPAVRYVDAWIRDFASGGTCCSLYEGSYNLAVNKDGICAISGTFSGDLRLNERITYKYDETQEFDGEMFLAAFNEKGEMKWSQRMNAPSYDKDIVALSNGSFVCAGFYVGATKLVTYRLAERDTGHFLMVISPSTGKAGKVYLNDSCAIENLVAGADENLYCTFQKNNSGIVYEVYQFNNKLQPKRLTRFTGSNPVITVVNEQFYCAGEYGWNCAFGDAKPNWLYIGGDSSSWGSFLARCSLKE